VHRAYAHCVARCLAPLTHLDFSKKFSLFRWRDRIRNAEAQLQAAGKDAGAANYADGGRDSVLSFVSGAETRAQSRFALAISGQALADNSADRRQVEDSVEACDVPTALGLLTSAVEEFERLCERGRSSGSSECSGNSAGGGKPLGESRVLPDSISLHS
jgi:hypothetical protein